jgi:hypothetical protein
LFFFGGWGGGSRTKPGIANSIYKLELKLEPRQFQFLLKNQKSEILHKSKEPPNVVDGCIWKVSISVSWWGKSDGISAG